MSEGGAYLLLSPPPGTTAAAPSDTAPPPPSPASEVVGNDDAGTDDDGENEDDGKIGYNGEDGDGGVVWRRSGRNCNENVNSADLKMRRGGKGCRSRSPCLWIIFRFCRCRRHP